MLKKEAWIALGILVSCVIILVSVNGSITGFVVGDDITLDVVLTKTSFSSGEKLQGYFNLNFTGPIDPLTELRVNFEDVSARLSLKDYFDKKNISFVETESSASISNPSESKSFTFGGEGFKKFAFKLPRYAAVSGFDMYISGSEGPSFVSFDVEDITGKEEWKYLGDFVKFKSDYIMPSSLDIDQEGDSAVIGGAAGQNETYFCELVELPESKDFKISTKIKKKSAGADIKAVLLSFDGEYAYGGAEFCDIPEPSVGAAPTWYSCELPFDKSKQGLYLACVYYEGGNEEEYYEISRDSTISDSRFTCPNTGGSTYCSPYDAKDYFIRVQAAEYAGGLDRTLVWEDGATDQPMNYSLTAFLSECEADEIGDCIVPVTLGSKTAGDIQIGGLMIDYTAEGEGIGHSTKFYDFTEVPGNIVELEGTDLTNGSKMIQIPFSEFNLTAPNITEESETIFLEVSLVPGGSITKPVKVYGEEYVPETGTIEGKISEAKKVISDMKTEHGNELEFFGIELDDTQLNSYESEVNSIKTDPSLSIEEINTKLANLVTQIDTYLQNQPSGFGLDTEFKDVYIPEPIDVEQVVLENVEGVYFYQDNVEVGVDVANYILTRYNEEEERYSMVTKTIKPKKTLSNFYIYEIIPKTLANNVNDIIFKDKNYEIVEQDPVVRYTFPSLSTTTTLTYGVKDTTITPDMFEDLKSIVVPEQLEEVEEKTHECGDGICTEPYEDRNSCPQDCGGTRPIPWIVIIVLVVILVVGVAYINFYKGKGAFRKLVSRSPFKNPKDLESVKNYIKTAQDKGLKKQDVAKALLKSGWTKDQIIYAFEDLKWDQKRLFTIRFAPGGKENVKKLETFIKKCLQLGIPEAKIRNVLIQKGWTADKINEAFATVGKPAEKVVTEKEKQKKIAFYFEKSLEEEEKK